MPIHLCLLYINALLFIKMHVFTLLAIILPVTALRPNGRRATYTRRSADAITFPQRDFIGDLGARYQQLVKDHYVPMACLQAAVLAGGADIATQTLEHAQALDYSHVAAMSTVACDPASLFGVASMASSSTPSMRCFGHTQVHDEWRRERGLAPPARGSFPR